MGNYLNTLLQNKNNPKIKKQLSLVSQMVDYNKSNYNTNLTESKTQVNLLYSDKNCIKSAITDRLPTSNYNKIEKVFEQTSSLFNQDFYKNNLSSNFFFVKLIKNKIR